MKKILSSLAAAALMAAPLTAYAVTVGQDTDPPEGQTQVSVDIDHLYTVTIPADTTVAFGAAQTDFGKAVKVSLTHGTLKTPQTPPR